MRMRAGLLDLTPSIVLAPAEGGGGGGGGGDAAAANGSEGAGAGKPAQGQGGEGTAAGVALSGDGEKLAKQLRELTEQNTALSAQVKELLTENVGRKKLVQKIAQATGELSPEELSTRLERLTELEQAEALRRGEYDKLSESFRGKEAGYKDEIVKLGKREAERMIHNRILAAAGMNRALDTSMAIPEGEDRPTIVRMTEHLFEYDADAGTVTHKIARDEAGKRMSPEAYFARERTKSLAPFFASGVVGGSGQASKGDAGSDADVVEIQYSDRDRVSKVEAAKKAGRPYRIVRAA